METRKIYTKGPDYRILTAFFSTDKSVRNTGVLKEFLKIFSGLSDLTDQEYNCFLEVVDRYMVEKKLQKNKKYTTDQKVAPNSIREIYLTWMRMIKKNRSSYEEFEFEPVSLDSKDSNKNSGDDGQNSGLSVSSLELDPESFSFLSDEPLLTPPSDTQISN